MVRAYGTLAVLRSPDEVPSSSLLDICARGADLIEILEVKDASGKRLGALVIAAIGDKRGRLAAHGVSVFSIEEIRYGHTEASLQSLPSIT